MKNLLFLVAIILSLLWSCQKQDINTPEAVRQGVIDYLSQRSDLNVDSLDVQVTSVTFNENEADAVVAIRLKGGGPAESMTMRYVLEREGNRWVVKGRASSGSPHGEMPSGDPFHGGSGSMELPPGHPPIGQQNPEAPAQ